MLREDVLAAGGPPFNRCSAIVTRTRCEQDTRLPHHMSTGQEVMMGPMHTRRMHVWVTWVWPVGQS